MWSSFWYDEHMPSFTKTYYDNTKSFPPSLLLTEALSLLRTDGRNALDLGCGAGRDTRLLLEKGFSVTAVDAEPIVEGYINELSKLGELTFVCSTFEDFVFGQYDLINARYSLPFSSPVHFLNVVENIKRSLLPGGIFVGQLFGVNDEWNTPDSEMTFYSREQALSLFSPLELGKFEEKDESGLLADGSSKHWHVFDIIATKP